MPLSQSPSAEKTAAAASNGRSAARDGDAMRRRFVEAARRAEIVALVNATSSEPELGLRFCEELCEVFEAEVAFVLDDGGEGGRPRAVGRVALTDATPRQLLERPESMRALKIGRGISIEGQDVLGIGVRAAILAPYRTEDGRVVLAGVARIYDLPFDDGDRSLVEAVTVAVGQALERIWAYQSRDRAAAQQTALVRAAKSISRSLEITDVLQTLCTEARSALEMDAVAACLGDEVDGYVALGADGLPDSFIGFRQSPGTGLGGRAVRAGRALATHVYDEEAYAPPEAPGLHEVRSSVAVPLRWDGRIRGFLSGGYESDRRITSREIELMEGFAELAGLACANAEQHANLRQEADLDGLTGCMNRDALLRRLSGLVGAAERGGSPLALALVDLDGFKSINDIFGHPSGDEVLKKVGAALRSTVRSGDVVGRYGGDEFALVLPNASEKLASPLLDRARTAIRSLDVPGGELTACVGLAEIADGETMQALIARADEALREAKHGPGPGSIRRASRSATLAAPMPSSMTDSARRERWRAIAGDIALDLARQEDSGASAAVAVTELRELLQLDTCTVFHLASGGRLESVAFSGPEAQPDTDGDADQGAVGLALREKRPILGDAAAGRRGIDLRSGRRSNGPRRRAAEIAVPILIGGRVWGGISCREGGEALDDVDAELVAAVGEHLSASIRTADLYEQLTKSMIGTAEALAHAMAAKDSYTADHAHSIAELAVEVGRQLELPESTIEDLRYGGIFHDIGKIAISDSIINKPGPLTTEEFEVVKEHPVVGAEILAPVPFLYGVRTIVRHAHEHWDGSGYPDGLRGTQIPLGARIVLAVDAYHAMTSDRPYRKRMPHEDACEELTLKAGEQFDPEVVDALLAVLARSD